MIRGHRKVRTRLALVYAALFLFGGAVLLGVTITLVQQALVDQPVNTSVEIPHLPEAPDTPVSLDKSAAQQSAEDGFAFVKRLQDEFRRSTLETLITRGTFALGAVAVVGAWLGWLAAGRTLRPLSQITATARRVAGRNLRERIALGGPHDELRELADTFDDMLCRLDAAFDSQRRFVANASHELKTPLAINRTLLEVALDSPEASADLRKVGGMLLEVNARQERLIESLLTLARSGQAVVDPVPVDLTQVTRRVVDSARPEARDAGVDVSVEFVAAPTVGDPVLLERLAQNLVQNAVRYNRPGGWVRLTCGRVDAHALLTVTNTGPPVAPDEAAGLFEPFRRLDDRVGSAEGNGLGLSIVRSVARAHGGEATAVPRDGGGLVVTVTIPTAR